MTTSYHLSEAETAALRAFMESSGYKEAAEKLGCTEHNIRYHINNILDKTGYTIIGAADEYGSGLTLDRPGMGKVTQAVLAGKVDVVLVHSLTRIGRELGMTQSYIDQLTRHKVKLLCIKERCLFSEKGVAHF